MKIRLPRDSFNSIKVAIQAGYISKKQDLTLEEWRHVIDNKDIKENVSRSLLFFQDLGLIERGRTKAGNYTYHLTDKFIQLGRAIVMKEEITERKIWRSIIDDHLFFKAIMETVDFYQRINGFIEKRTLKEKIIELSAYEKESLTNKSVFEVFASTIVNLLVEAEVIEHIGKLKIIRSSKSFISNEMDNFPPEIRLSLKKFREDYPHGKTTAFIIMQFGKTVAHQNIVDAIKQCFDKHGIVALRADDKEYHTSLLGNVLTYIYGCKFSVAVFERIEADKFNPNVSFEVGYMRALNKPVCILKDQTMSTLPTDLLGDLYKSFDSQDPKSSIPPQIEKWLKDQDMF